MKRKYLILFSLSGLILSCDQLTKHLVHTYLDVNHDSVLVPHLLSLKYSQNMGFAFGMLKKAPESLQNIFFIGVPIFALILILLIFIKLQDNQMVTSVALSTILAGAIGNLIDRIQYGYVIDFLDFHWNEVFHVAPFNLADCSIIMGVGLVFIGTLLKQKPSEMVPS